jgi:16S rRNA (uracil1498-N3)-methyltransferase
VERVLRLRPGGRITLLDDSGLEYVAKLGEVEGGQVRGRILSAAPAEGEPRLQIALFQALLKARSLEAILQRCTEVGVSRFVPIVSGRCVARRVSPARLARWRRIIREAAEQSQRGRLPEIRSPIPLEEALRTMDGEALSLIPWEGGGESLASALGGARPQRVNLFIGPEGGFAEREIELARAHGLIPITLGPRILRAETASLVAATAILYHMGELG